MRDLYISDSMLAQIVTTWTNAYILHSMED
jgi:hypothetical protein